MSALGAGRTDNLPEKVKVCNTCGNVGFDDCLAFCSHCNEGAEHVYCMATVYDTVPQDWACEGCKVKQRENSGKRRFVCDGLQPIQAHKKQALSKSFSSKSMGLLHSSSFKNDSFENGTEHFVTIQADKALSKASSGPACQVQSMGGATKKEISLGGNNSNERNSVCMVAPDVKKSSCPVMPLRGISAKVSCFETGKAVSTSRCHNDMKKITQKDLPVVSPKTCTEMISTLPNSQSVSVVARVVEELSCLAEPLESLLVKEDTSAIALDMKLSGERIGSEEHELNNSVLTSLAKGKPRLAKAENRDLNKTAAFSSSSLAKPVAAKKESFFGTGKIEHHNLNRTVTFSLSSFAKPVATEKESMGRAASVHTTSMAERNSVKADEDIPKHTDSLIKRTNLVYEEENHTVTSLERPISKPQHAIVNSMPMKTESDNVVKRSTQHMATRDFPNITQKIKVLGEEGEKILNMKPKEKLPGKADAPLRVEGLSCTLVLGGNVLVKEETAATGQDLNGSGNKLQAKEEVNIIHGSAKSLCEGEKEHHQSGGILVKATTAGRKTDGSCNKLKAKEEENAFSGSVEPPNLFSREEMAQPQNVKQKGGVAGSLSCLIVERPSLFSEEEKTQPQDVKQKGGMAGSPSCLTSGSGEPLFSEEEKVQPQNVKQKGRAAVSPKSSGGSGSRAAPTHSVPAIERNVEFIVLSPCMMKEPSCEVVHRQEESTRVASGMDKISSIHLKRVARRDFPPLIEKARKIVGPSRKETITSKIVTPLEVQEQVTGCKSDADTEKVTRRDVPAIPLKVLPGNLKNGSSSTSMGNLAAVIMPSVDDKRLSCPSLPVGGVSAKHTVSSGIHIKAASRRLEVEEEVLESKESAIFPLCSHDTRPEDKECLGNAKQECDATVLSSCVTKELPTNGVSSVEVASVIKTVPTNFESASKRKTTKKNFSSPPYQEGTSSKGVAILKCAKGPSCLPGEMEGVTVNDTSNEKKEVCGRGRLSGGDALDILLNSSGEGECVDTIGGRSILRQKGEVLEAGAASSCQVRSTGKGTLAQGIAMRDAFNVHSDKVTFTGKRVPSVEAEHVFADRDFSDKVKFSPGRHTSRPQCAFDRSASTMDGDDQLSYFEPRLRDSPRRKKAAVLSSISSIRDRYRNATYIERESEDGGFYARHEDAECEPSNRMGLRKSTLVRPRHHTLPGRDVEFRSKKQDHYSRGSRHQAGDSGSYKEAYRCHRCDQIGHSTEFCKIDRRRERRTFSPDFDDRDLPDSRSDPGHAKRIFTGFQGSDGRKSWRDDPRREERFMNSSRSQTESNAVDCAQMCFKRPPKVSEHTRFDEERSNKSHLREEARFEREGSRLEIPHSSNGMKSDLKPFLKQSEYIRVHKRQIVRAQPQDSCKAGIAVQGPLEQPPFVATEFENGKVFPVQGNASLFPGGPAGAPRGGYVNRLLPNQVPRTPQDQVNKNRISETHVASRFHGSSIRDFAQARRAAPDRQVMWSGCFNVSSRETCYQGIQARPSNMANSKVFEALLALPSQLEMEEKKRGVETDSWPRSFQESPPTSHSIGIYFFSTDLESYGKWYKPLLHRLAAQDLALKVKLEFAQLLIFPSLLLPEAEQCWEDRFFLWGIFRNKKVVQGSSNLLWQPSDRDPGSELGSPTGNGEVIDMVGGEDTVSREWQEFSPPLPPGFAAAPPYLLEYRMMKILLEYRMMKI